MFVPNLLASILVVISFHWDTAKLTLFKSALHEVLHYRLHTNVDIVVITDNDQAVLNTLSAYNYKHVSVHLFNTSSSKHYTGNKFDLLWEHREVVQDRFDNFDKYGNYSTFLYFEDDTLVPWSRLVSWAIDNEMLEPLGFTRGIYRTEINKSGKLSLNDMVTDLANFLGCNMNITYDANNPHTVNTLDLLKYSTQSKELYENTVAKYSTETCLNASISSAWSRRRKLTHDTHEKRANHAVLVPCPVHKHFVNFYSPFQGMWVYSRSQLAKIIQDPLWDRWNSMRKENRRPGQRNWSWGSPERSNSILYFVQPPTGFLTTNVVPFDFVEGDHTRPRLSDFGAVEHLRNAYDIICTVEEALVV